MKKLPTYKFHRVISVTNIATNPIRNQHRTMRGSSSVLSVTQASDSRWTWKRIGGFIIGGSMRGSSSVISVTNVSHLRGTWKRIGGFIIGRFMRGFSSVISVTKVSHLRGTWTRMGGLNMRQRCLGLAGTVRRALAGDLFSR